MQTHAAKDVECPGCCRMFVSESAMVLHLEAGTCDSGVDSDRVNEIACECYQSKKYTRNDDSGYDFECPTCSKPFTLMSGLLQHVESDNCDEELDRWQPLGKFLHFLRSQI